MPEDEIKTDSDKNEGLEPNIFVMQKFKRKKQVEKKETSGDERTNKQKRCP
jgi:hypothetical protein